MKRYRNKRTKKEVILDGIVEPRIGIYADKATYPEALVFLRDKDNKLITLKESDFEKKYEKIVEWD